MLDFMRRNARSTAIKVIFWMIIIVFVFWGVGIMVAGGDKVNVAATVDDDVISTQEYARAYERMQQVYRQIYRENFTPQVVAQLNLRQRALDDLITDRLLKREAARLRLQVSDDEVREAILGIPSFHSDGRFDRQRYLVSLRASRLSPTEFEESQRETLLISKLESLLTDGLSVSDQETRDLFVMENEKIDVTFVKVPLSRFTSGVSVSDDEIASYYEQNREQFRQPDRATLTYVAYTPEAIEPTIPVSDEAIRTYYDAHLSDYETTEKIRVLQILFLVPPDADQEARSTVRSKAEGVLAQAREGKDFATLAREHSDDPLTKDAGGDLGSVERGSLEGALDQAAFGLEVGQVSGIVEGTRGFSILKVEERQAAAARPLEEVREDIVRELRKRGADDAARAALGEDLAKAREGAPLDTLAAARGLTAVTPPPLAQNQRVPGVKGTALQTAALGLDVDSVETVEGVEPPYYLFKVTGKTPSFITPLEEARAGIAETLRTDKAKEAARGEAAGILDAARSGGLDGFVAAAKAKEYAVEDTGPFSRSEPIPKIGAAPIKDDLFALTSAAPVGRHPYLYPDAAVAVVLKQRSDPDETALTAEKRTSIRDSALARKREQVLESYRTLLRQRADISVNPDIMAGGRG